MISKHLLLTVLLLPSLSPGLSAAARKRLSGKEAMSAALNAKRDAIQGCMASFPERRLRAAASGDRLDSSSTVSRRCLEVKTMAYRW